MLAAEGACLESGRTRSSKGSEAHQGQNNKFEETKLTCCNHSARVANAGLHRIVAIEEALGPLFRGQVVNALSSPLAR